MSRLATPIRKNDNVLVITGKDRGKRGRVLRVVPDTNRLVVEGVNMIKRHTKPNPGKNVQGGIVEREASLHASNVAARVPRMRRTDARRPQGARRRPEGQDLPQVRGSRRQMSARLREQVPEGRHSGPEEGVRLHERDGRAQDSEGRREHGPRRGDEQREARRRRRRRARAHHGPEAGDAPFEEVDCGVQSPQGHAGRHDGHAARRAHVGVPRSADDHRAAARPRLQGRVAARGSTAAATTRSDCATS